MSNILQEDTGLVKIHAVCVGMNAIWRPTPCHDLGVDGQIEFLEPDSCVSTGSIVAVQSKSGPSYFAQQSEHDVTFYPEQKHRQYWMKLRMPVILVLHNPDRDETYYCEVKPQLGQGGPISVKKRNVFSPRVRDELIKCVAADYQDIDPNVVLNKLRSIKHNRDGNREITGVDLLVACTDRSRVCFELRMCRISALFSCLTNGRNIYIGPDDYDYICRTVTAIHMSRITEDFWETFDEVWFDQDTVPDIAVPLTPVGIKVVNKLWAAPEQYISMDSYADLHRTTALEIVEFISDHANSASETHEQWE